MRHETLGIDALLAMLPDARALGFNAIAISGGEPLVYRPLPRLLAAANALGFLTSITTNALLVTEARLAALAPVLSLLAISLDGVPASHDRMRGSSTAFARMKARLGMLRASGVPFGFIFTLTMRNLEELDWVAAFAAAEGASLLQVHPLESAGRAAETCLAPPDERELSFAFLEVARLQRAYADRLVIQFDVLHRPLVRASPARAFADDAEPVGGPLAALLSPIVVQTDGWIVPMQYGFNPAHAIGRLGEAPFATLAERYVRDRYPGFRQLAARVWAEIEPAPAHLPFVNWYAAITRGSYV